MTSVPTLYQTPPQSQHAQQGPPMANLPNSVAPPPMGGLLPGNIPGAGAPGVYTLTNQPLQRGIQQQMIPQPFGPQSGQVPQSMTSLQPNASGLPNMNFNGQQVYRARQQQPGPPRSQLPLQAQQNPMMPGSSNLAHLQQNGLLGMSMNNANLQQPFRSPIPAVGQSQQFLRQQPGVSPSPASQQPTLQGAPGQPGQQQQQQQPSGPAQLNHMQVMPSNLHREFSTAQGLPQGQQPQQSPGQMQLAPQHQRAGSLGMNLPAGMSATAGGMMQRPVMTNLSTQPPPPTLTQAHVQAQQPQQQQQMHPANAMNPSMHPHQQQQQQSHQSANPSSAPPFTNPMVMHQNNPHQLGQQPQSQGMHAGGPLGMQASAGHIGPMGVGMGAGLGGVVGTNGGPSPPQRPGSHQHGLPHSQPQTPSGTPMTTAPGPIPVRPQSRTTGIGGGLGMGDKGMMNANVVGGGVGMGGVSGSNAGAGMQQYNQVMSSLQNHQPMAALAPMGRLAGPQPGVGGAQNQPPGGAPVPGPSGAGAPYAFQQANMAGGRTTPSHTSLPMASLTASASGPSAVGSRTPMGSMPPYGMQNPGVAHGQTFMTPAQMYNAHGNPGVAGIAAGDAQRPPSRQRLGQQPLTHPGGAGAPGMGTPGVVHPPPGAQFGGSGRQTPGSQMVGVPPSQMSPARPGSAMHQQQQQQGHQPHPGGTPGMAHPSTPHLVNTQPAHHAMGQDQQQQQQQQQALNMQHLRSQQAQQVLQQQQQSAQQQHIMAHLPQQAGRSQSPAVNAQQHPSGGPGGMGQAGQAMSSVQGQPGQVQVQSGVNRTPRTQTAQLPPQPGSTQQQQQPPPMNSLGQTSLVNMGLRPGMGPPQQLGMQQQQQAQQSQGQQQGVPSPKQRPPSTVQHGQQASVGQQQQQQPVQQTSPSQRASQTPIPPSPRQVQQQQQHQGQQGQQGQQPTTGPQAPTQTGQPLPPAPAPQPSSSVQTGGTSSIAPIPIQANATGVTQLARGSVVGMPPFAPGQQPVVGPVGVGVAGMPPTPGGAGVPLGMVRGPVTMMTDGTPIHSSYQMPATAALARFLQFSGVLASESTDRVRLDYWKGVVHDFFTERAMVIITLWKDNQRTEAKPFDIGVPILPRFFLITSQSGVKSMSFTLDNAVENPGRGGGGTSTIECPNASWTYRYDNGYTVVLKGPLYVSTQFVPSAGNRYMVKFDSIRFDAYEHEKSLSIDAIIGHREPTLTPRIRNVNTPGATPNMAHAEDSRSSSQAQDEYRIVIEKANIPTEPVNAFGIPQATMRCLELAESVAQMDELIRFSTKTKTGPIDALKMFCENMRQDGGVHLINGAPQRPGDQSSPLMASTPSASAQTPTNGPHPAGPSGSTTSTPQLTNATLKRKNQAGDASSPTTGPGEQPPAKRANRKRKMTAGGS